MAVEERFAARLGRMFVAFAAVVVLVTGCTIFEETQDTQLALDFAAVLPDGWRALGTWHVVNIDGDEDVEYLLLFQYDSGQVGAVIYDPQTSSDYIGVSEPPDTVISTGTVEIVTAPLQSFGFYRPYRLLPSYWSYTYESRVGHGLVAFPSDANRVGVFEVPAAGVSGAVERGTTEEVDAKPGEIVLRGGDTHLTFIWWKSIAEGYGVTQLVAPGGFVGIDWPSWEEEPYSIEQLYGLYPLTDYRGRSLLCREARFDRQPATSETDGGVCDAANEHDDATGQDLSLGTPVRFSEVDMGLRFCGETPQHPFYPEGVVMAYMARFQVAGADASDEDAGDSLLTPGITAEQIAARLDQTRIVQERVMDVETYATIPVSPSTLQSGAFAPTTTVCAELAPRGDMANDTGGDHLSRRWLVFTLRYQPPSLAQRLPDRWTISDITAAPPPVPGSDTDYCRTILELSQD